MKPISLRVLSTRSWIAVAGLSLTLACGDDSQGMETDGSSGGSGSTTMESTSSTTDDPASSTTDDSTTTSTSTTGGSASSGTTGTDGTGTDGTGTDGTSTGTGGVCGDLDMATCEMTDGCAWEGNPNNGTCVEVDPADCPNFDNLQDCNASPVCSWNNMAGVCGAA